MHSRVDFNQQLGAPADAAAINDGFPRLRGERGFIPLRPEIMRQYEAFWTKNIENIQCVTAPFKNEYEAWPDDWYYNMWFDAGDPELYYSMIRTYKPNRIIEVGSGYCTRIAAEACQVNGKGRITCIDPMPRTDLPPIVSFEKTFVQNVDLTLFDVLGENDFLFIDSSHEAEEAIYHYLILDRLAPGVIVHHHDFMFPLLPDWPEENVIISYYMNHADQWEGIVSSAGARHKLGVEGYDKLFDHHKAMDRYAGSIYTRKIRAEETGAAYHALQAEYTRTAAYAARVTREYEETHARRMELEKTFRDPRLMTRALASEALSALSRRLKP